MRLVGGEVAGMVGLNGSGKSTFLMAVFGALPQADGTVHIDGEYCSSADRWRRVSLLPQTSFLPRDLRLQRAALLYVGRAGLSFLRDDSRACSLLSSKVGDLSSGERRYAEFLLVLALERDFVLLDEPFAQIEPVYVERMVGAIRAFKKTGFLLTDQNHRELRRTCDRALVMSHGHLQDIGSADSDLRGVGYLP